MLLHRRVKLDHWCREEMYEKYAIELIRKEGVETALERSVNTMMEWAEENEPAPWNHYFCTCKFEQSSVAYQRRKDIAVVNT